MIKDSILKSLGMMLAVIPLLTVSSCAAPQTAAPMASQQVTTPKPVTNQQNTAQTSFVHPGIPLTKTDLAQLKANLNKEPWKTAYTQLAGDGRSSLDYKLQGPFEQVRRAPGRHMNRNQWGSDVQAAWNLSRMWFFTDNPAYAQKARDILIAWATTQKVFDGMEANLDLGDNAFKIVGAADILRGTWPGWTQTDTDAMKSLFGNVYWPVTGAGGKSALGPANKAMLSLVAAAAIAVFLDDREKLNQVIYLFRTHPSGALRNTLPTGQIGESGRDQGHAYGQWLSMAMLAEICWSQGIDLFSENDNRLMAIGEYFSRANLLVPTPYTIFGTTDYMYWKAAGAGWGGGRMGLDILHGAYVVRKGLRSPYLEKRRSELGVNSDSFMFVKSSDQSQAKSPAPLIFPETQLVTKGLTSRDIGDATPAGNSAYNEGVWQVTGAGHDIWTYGPDSLHFVSMPVKGDCAIIARVDALENAVGTAKAGVMIRSSLTPDAASVWAAVTANKTIESYLRGWAYVYGGTNWDKKSHGLPQMPYWLKIERYGDVITSFMSPDGASWATIAVGDYSKMGPDAHIGLAVCSLKNGSTITARFSHVSVTGGDGAVKPVVPDAPLAVVASPGNKQVPLRWLESFGATEYIVKRAVKETGPFQTLTTTRGTSFTDKNVVNGTTYFYGVSARNASGESPLSALDSVMPQAPMINFAPEGNASASVIGTTVGQGADKAFDGNVGSKWYSGDKGGTSGWLQLDFGQGQTRIVRSYELVSGNDTPGRDPKDWALQASVDGQIWATLDAQTNQTFSTRGENKRFAIENSKAYRFYRLSIQAIANTATDAMQLAEIRLIGEG